MTEHFHHLRFDDEVVDLRNNEFYACEFTRCVLVGTPRSMEFCKMTDCEAAELMADIEERTLLEVTT